MNLDLNTSVPRLLTSDTNFDSIRYRYRYVDVSKNSIYRRYGSIPLPIWFTKPATHFLTKIPNKDQNSSIFRHWNWFWSPQTDILRCFICFLAVFKPYKCRKWVLGLVNHIGNGIGRYGKFHIADIDTDMARILYRDIDISVSYRYRIENRIESQ